MASMGFPWAGETPKLLDRVFCTESEEAVFINQYVQSFSSFCFLLSLCNREGEEDVEGGTQRGRGRRRVRETNREQEREREREQNPLLMAKNAFP